MRRCAISDSGAGSDLGSAKATAVADGGGQRVVAVLLFSLLSLCVHASQSR